MAFSFTPPFGFRFYIHDNDDDDDDDDDNDDRDDDDSRNRIARKLSNGLPTDDGRTNRRRRI